MRSLLVCAVAVMVATSASASDGTFTTLTCGNSTCKSQCGTPATFKLNYCLSQEFPSTGSYKATSCSASEGLVKMLYTSSDCSGTATKDTKPNLPVDKCFLPYPASAPSTYQEITCTPPPGPDCRAITNCAECTTARSGLCGWCDATNLCQQGGFTAPNDSNCDYKNWHWNGAYCPVRYTGSYSKVTCTAADCKGSTCGPATTYKLNTCHRDAGYTGQGGGFIATKCTAAGGVEKVIYQTTDCSGKGYISKEHPAVDTCGTDGDIFAKLSCHATVAPPTPTSSTSGGGTGSTGNGAATPNPNAPFTPTDDGTIKPHHYAIFGAIGALIVVFIVGIIWRIFFYTAFMGRRAARYAVQPVAQNPMYVSDNNNNGLGAGLNAEAEQQRNANLIWQQNGCQGPRPYNI